MTPNLLNWLDWTVLVGTLALIVGYGIYRTRRPAGAAAYLMGDGRAQWWGICLSIMATQASAITFLSGPGQAYNDGLRFIQFYLGLPLAMVVLSITAVPLYNRLKVFTAYQFLEERFDVRTRTLASGLFLLQRGLSTGITIYAPSIVLSTVLGWSLQSTILLIGLAVIAYTVVGGNRAVSVTHQQQMLVIFLGMGAAAYIVIHLLPDGMDLSRATQMAGNLGKMNALDLTFDPKERYNLWSGLIGGFFLQLSYFGTDQSQVARYLGGETVAQSRMGLLLNGLVKIPMQLGILFIGVLVYVFYLFNTSPLYWNQHGEAQVLASPHATAYQELKAQHQQLQQRQQSQAHALQQALASDRDVAPLRAELQQTQAGMAELRIQAKALVKSADPRADVNDSDYVFITFILHNLPRGLVGLLLAVMFSAAMSSTSAALTSLGGTTVIDIYQRLFRPTLSGAELLWASRVCTVGWGLVAIGFALVAGLVENLIQAVNILGSLFYGTMLGIFLTGFYVRRIGGRAVFWGALGAQAVVFAFFLWVDSVSYLWYNVIGCLLVVGFAGVGEKIFGERKKN